MDSTIARVPVGAPQTLCVSFANGPSDDALLAGLLAAPAPVLPGPPARAARAEASPRPAWAAPARLRPARARCQPAPPWSTARVVARPLAAAAALLLAGGSLASTYGAAPARAEATLAPAGLTSAVAAPAPGGTLAVRRAAHTGAQAARAHAGALATLHPASARDAALLAGLLEAPVAAPSMARGQAAALESEPPAAAPAAPVPAPAVSFATVVRLPAAALAAPAVVVHQLPMITLAQNVIPPPPPPAPVRGQAQQPAPPGYVQPPGYRDGVPFGGQPGAVPGSSAARPPAGRPSTNRPTASVYVVRAGDTLTAIALRFYGDASRAPLIWEANYRVIGANPNRIVPGQRLTLPGLTTRPAARPPTPLPARGPIAQRANYTIQPRDYLRWMAERAYGNEVFWPEIFRANRNVLGPNPDLIYPGVTVYIP